MRLTKFQKLVLKLKDFSKEKGKLTADRLYSALLMYGVFRLMVYLETKGIDLHLEELLTLLSL